MDRHVERRQSAMSDDVGSNFSYSAVVDNDGVAVEILSIAPRVPHLFPV